MSQPDAHVEDTPPTRDEAPMRLANGGGHDEAQVEASTPPRDPSAPSTFVALPGVVHSHIASFLHERTIRRLWTLSRWTLDSPELTPVAHVLQVEANGSLVATNGEYARAACSSLIRLLSRGKGACTRVIVRNIRTIRLLASALQQEPRLNTQLLELKLDPLHPEDQELVAGMSYLADLLEEGYFSDLRRLSFGEKSDKECPIALLRTLGRGVCPSLEALETFEVSFGCLNAFVNAMAERNEGCAPFRGLKVQSRVQHEDQQEKEQVGTRLLEARCLARLESIDFEIPWSSRAVAAYLRTSANTSKLTELRLNHFDISLVEDCGQDLALALAEGAAPLLETLCLIDISVTDPAITELCESIKSRRVLQHLRKLELRELFEAPQDVISLMGAIGHGCPEVRSVRLWCDYRKSRYLGFSNAVAAALRASDRALVHMEELSIFDYPGHDDLTDLAAAMNERHGGLPSLRRLSIWQEYGPMDATSMSALGEIIIRAPRIRHLDLLAKNEGMDVCVLDALGRSLAAGGLASQHLVEIRIEDFNHADVAGMLRSFVAGACPRLQRFIVENDFSAEEGAERWHLGQEALVALLSGEARCSATLRHLDLSRSCVFDADQASRAIDAINLPSAIRLRTLKGLGSTAGLQSCMDLLRAYSGAHAGGRLHALQLHLVGLEDDEAGRVADEAVRLIDEGAWPSLLWDWDQEELHTGLEVRGRRQIQHNGLQTAVKKRYLQLKHVIRGY